MTSVLVVDDSRAVRRIIRRTLEEDGFKVREASNGKEALEVIEGGNVPDVVFLDWNMPEMDGMECLEALARLPGGIPCKVLMCTTNSDEGSLVTAIEAGACDYVMKPFDADIIRSKLRSHGFDLEETSS